jgi:hypothetical protein
MNDAGLNVLRNGLGAARVGRSQLAAKRDRAAELLAAAEASLARAEQRCAALEDALSQADAEFSPGDPLPITYEDFDAWA